MNAWGGRGGGGLEEFLPQSFVWGVTMFLVKKDFVK